MKESPVANNDRLKQEDALTQKVETPKVEPVETKADIVEDNLPLDAKEMTLQDDMKIIQNLGNTTTPTVVNETEILPTHPETPVVETPAPTPVASTMNLDSLLGSPAEATTTTAVKNPFDLVTPATNPAPAQAILQTPAAPAIADAAAKKTKNVKMLFFVVLFVALGFIGYFVITTMYPMGL
ncbi:MAG: hypothetical protein WCG98_05530 [bacterium]